MSRIFDALRRAQQARVAPGTDKSALPPHAERRRSSRWNAHVPVFIYGHASSRHPFHEEAYSANVSEFGGLLVMSATVRPGQKLLLTNKVTQQDQECRVIHVGGHDPQSVEVAVEFPERAPVFWRVTAPPRSAAKSFALDVEHTAGALGRGGSPKA